MKKIVSRQMVLETELLADEMHPLLYRIYSNRGVTTKEQLDLGLENLLSYENLLNIEKAVDCLYEYLQDQKKALIIGDFDVDGATSTAVAIKVLRAFGFKYVNYLIPNRFEHGYGFGPEVAMAAMATEDPHLIITVDNGIASIDGVDTANKLGMEVLITDHHLPGDQLPNARAIINPNQEGDMFESKNLAGVGVIFYVLLAFRKKLRDEDWFNRQNIPEPNMAQFLDLVALGTVADVVSLDRNNRILVANGMRRIRSGRCNPGIKALLAVAKRDVHKIVASDMSFSIAPRLNAAGRLDDMKTGIECLLVDNGREARELALQLDSLNEERKSIEVSMHRQVNEDIAQLKLGDDLPKGICLFDEKWHQGVVGLLASRIKDQINRPVIAFAKISDEEIKGSARSITGLHIRDLLKDVDESNPELITRFGGHAMAAAVHLPIEKYEDFCNAFINTIETNVSEEELCDVLYTDGELRNEEISLEIAELLQISGPWGQGFPEPMFEGQFDIISQDIVGQRHLKLSLKIPGEFRTVDAIAFNVNLDKWPNHNVDTLKAVYRLDVNEYRNKRNIQLIIAHME